MLYFTYSDLADSTLPNTIQAGTYVFEARIGNGTVFDFSGLNTPPLATPPQVPLPDFSQPLQTEIPGTAQQGERMPS